MFEVAGQTTPFCLNSLNKLFVRERKTGKLKWVFFQIHVLCTYLSIAATAYYSRALQARRCIWGHGSVIVPNKLWADKLDLCILIFYQGGRLCPPQFWKPPTPLGSDKVWFGIQLQFDALQLQFGLAHFFSLFLCRSCTSKLNILLTEMEDPEKIFKCQKCFEGKLIVFWSKVGWFLCYHD
jgi:hypothetical protein